MKKSKGSPGAPAWVMSPQLSKHIDAVQAIALKVKVEGFITADALKEEFGAERATVALALLYGQHRVFKKVPRPWKDGLEVQGYEWADRRFSTSMVAKLPPEMGWLADLSSPGKQKYGEYVEVNLRCRYTNTVLGALPGDTEDDLHRFEGSGTGDVLILRYNQRAMASKALPMIGKEQAIARRIGWRMITIPNAKIKIHRKGVVDEKRHEGKGIKRSESIPAGTEFTISAMVPTSALSVSEFVQMIRMAGERVGLSPAGSSGFGDFEVLGEA